MNIYFGDIHNHCNISYGFGNLEIALMEAREHLDFCSITGHAYWPDIFRRNEDTEFIIDFHKKGFEKLSKDWGNVRETVRNANKEGEFVTFQSYEMHSCGYGDHHFLSPDDDLELIGGKTPADAARKHNARIIAIPHHVAYTPGYRGISWNDFDETISPVVEVYSKHGCAVSDESAGEYLHTMGPRDGRNTIYSGLKQGKRFGFAGSTDHHAGYPGSYGDGLTAVLAERLDRDSLWEAILNRRTYALTGDRIRCSFTVNGSTMGSFIEDPGNAVVKLDVDALDFIDRAVIYKNLEPEKVVHRENFFADPWDSDKFKVRIEVGWGRKNTPYRWKNDIKVNKGKLVAFDKCFRGRNVLAPREGEEHPDDINSMKNWAASTVDNIAWECTTFKNAGTGHSSTCALVLEIEGGPETELMMDMNGRKQSISILDIINNGISGHIKDYNSEAFLIHKAVPESAYHFEMAETVETKPGDFIHAEVHQVNGQSAWITPVFIERRK